MEFIFGHSPTLTSRLIIKISKIIYFQNKVIIMCTIRTFKSGHIHFHVILLIYMMVSWYSMIFWFNFTKILFLLSRDSNPGFYCSIEFWRVTDSLSIRRKLNVFLIFQGELIMAQTSHIYQNGRKSMENLLA